jgi:hypothetical protein
MSTIEVKNFLMFEFAVASVWVAQEVSQQPQKATLVANTIEYRRQLAGHAQPSRGQLCSCGGDL